MKVPNTERNRGLERRMAELRLLFEQAPGFMAVLRGPDHVFELANAAYCRLVGHRDFLGQRLVDALPEIASQGFVDLLDGVLATGTPFVGTGVSVRLRNEPGAPLTERILDFVYQPLVGADGRVTGVFVQGNDVTERKRAEDALHAADRRKNEFLATLAHELRNPLAPIRHAATITRAPQATAAQMSWAHEVIDRQVDHMSRLIDELLEISRITQGKLELRRARIGLRESLAAVVETVRPLIEGRGHTLVMDVPEAPLEIDADPVRFAQIFTNLLTNAAKYTDAGGVVRVRAEARDAVVVVVVSDTGIGIAPSSLATVFEMFSQVTSALERTEGGLGIGLALVRGLVLLHGGSIEAHSLGLGHGSEFTVTLPRARSETRVDCGDPAAAGKQEERAIRRVLVVDDNHDSADSCSMLLEMQGFDVRTAYSGTEALALAAELQPDIALVDIGMPGLNGYDVARAIRAADWGRGITLVAVTGWSQPEDKRQVQLAGFDHHFVKPVDLAALLRFLKEDG